MQCGMRGAHAQTHTPSFVCRRGRVVHTRCCCDAAASRHSAAALVWAAPPALPRRCCRRGAAARAAAGDEPPMPPPPDAAPQLQQRPPRSAASVARRAWGVAWPLLRRLWRPALFAYACVTFNLPLLAFWAANRQAPVGDVPVKRSEEEWAALLPPPAFDVLVKRGTERAFSSALEREERPGTFACAGCGAALFDAATKFDSGTGWPSFFDAMPGAVTQTVQPLYCIGDFGARECRCTRCGGHLGHVFSDGPKPTGKRFCMNGVAMAFTPREG